jgi:lipid-A-disaccharide synthase
VLCLLPFEQPWLEQRGVPATFVGHPAFTDLTAGSSDDLPRAHPRLAILPGSRRNEIVRNLPTMIAAFIELRRRHPDLNGVVAVLDERSATLARQVAPNLPKELTLTHGRTEAVLDWCDLALVVSGTVTLQVTARHKPMVAMYNMGVLQIFAAGIVVKTRTFTLPNLIAEWAGFGRAVPELVPHHGQVKPVVEAIEHLLTNPAAAKRQRTLLADVAARFGALRFDESAAREVLAAL